MSLGWAPWSPRLVEAMVFGCIPVIIADDSILPFTDAIPWEENGVFLNKKNVLDFDKLTPFHSIRRYTEEAETRDRPYCEREVAIPSACSAR